MTYTHIFLSAEVYILWNRTREICNFSYAIKFSNVYKCNCFTYQYKEQHYIRIITCTGNVHWRPKVFILVVDIDPFVNQDFCNEGVVIPSTLKERKKKLKYNILTSYDKVYYKFWWVENSYANFGSVEVYLTWERMYSHFSTNLQEKSICKTSGEIESVSSGNKNKKEGADSIKRKIFQCFDPLHL